MSRHLALGLWGALIGVGAAWLGAHPAGSQAASLPTTVADEIARPAPWWFDPNETVIGPTVLIPRTLAVADGEAVFSYEIRDIAPEALGRVRGREEINPFFATPGRQPVVAPELWTMVMRDGTQITGSTQTTRAASARFPVDDTFAVDQIAELRIDAWRMRVPLVYDLEIETTPEAAYPLDNGVELIVARVLEQRSSTIVQLDLVLPLDDFTVAETFDAPRIQGVGPLWLAAGPRSSGGIQLSYGAGEIPDTVTIRIRSIDWIHFNRPITVELGGIDL